MKHTPTPWAYNPIASGRVETRANGVISVIAFCPETTLAEEAGGDTQSNAQFIVTACNNHEQMLEALKAAYADLQTGTALDLVTAVIDKIEAEEPDDHPTRNINEDDPLRRDR